MKLLPLRGGILKTRVPIDRLGHWHTDCLEYRVDSSNQGLDNGIGVKNSVSIIAQRSFTGIGVSGEDETHVTRARSPCHKPAPEQSYIYVLGFLKLVALCACLAIVRHVFGKLPLLSRGFLVQGRRSGQVQGWENIQTRGSKMVLIRDSLFAPTQTLGH